MNNIHTIPSALRRSKTLTLTDHAMQAIAMDLPPMGAGFPKHLVARAKRLDVSHDRAGGVHYTLRAADEAVLGEVGYHHNDAQLPRAYRPPREVRLAA